MLASTHIRRNLALRKHTSVPRHKRFIMETQAGLKRKSLPLPTCSPTAPQVTHTLGVQHTRMDPVPHLASFLWWQHDLWLSGVSGPNPVSVS